MINIIAIRSRFRAFSQWAITLFVSLLIGSGCAGPGMTKPTIKARGDNIVYEVTAQEALDLAHWAVAQVLSEQKILRLEKPRLGLLVHEVNQPGHYKYARFRETSYTYELDLIPSMGRTAQNVSVTGFTYTIKGNGDLKSGPQKVAQLEQHLKNAFGQSGRATAVTFVKAIPPGPPRISATKPVVSVPLANPPAGVSPSVAVPKTPAVKEAPTDEDAFIKLKKLKALLDQGIITEEEFQIKKKELLDRI